MILTAPCEMGLAFNKCLLWTRHRALNLHSWNSLSSPHNAVAILISVFKVDQGQVPGEQIRLCNQLVAIVIEDHVEKSAGID